MGLLAGHGRTRFARHGVVPLAAAFPSHPALYESSESHVRSCRVTFDGVGPNAAGRSRRGGSPAVVSESHHGIDVVVPPACLSPGRAQYGHFIQVVWPGRGPACQWPALAAESSVSSS